jgi:hypothetical protein
VSTHWPQFLWLFLVVLNLGVHLAKHGEPLTTQYSFGYALARVTFTLWLLWAGGFFRGFE